jgi:NADP-dependent 3-hydroxy acid dehydrogenase YdfG
MDLEADLGIDSIKRVEIMGELQERFPGTAQVEPDQIGELPTLGDIVNFLAANTANTASTGVGAAPAAQEEPQVVRTVAYPPAPGIARSRYVRRPVAAPDLLANAYAPGSVALVVDDGAPVTRAVVEALRADGLDVRVVALPGVSAMAPGAQQLDDWSVQTLQAVVDGIVAATGRLDVCVQVAGTPVVDVPAAVRRLTHALLVAKVTQRRLQATAGTGRSTYAVVSALDGAGGLGGGPVRDVLLGALGGLVKTLAIEAPELFCRAVDVAPAVPQEAVPGLLRAELSDQEGALREVGHDGTGRTVPDLAAALASEDDGLGGPGVDDLLVVTGGARGVTAECLAVFAEHFPCGLLLLGRTPLGEEPTWAAGLADAALKSAIFARLKADGTAPTPRDVQRVYQEIVSSREIRSTLRRLTAAGARPEYLAVDVLDRAAVATALAPYRGRVSGVVHGAGVLADRLVVDKDAEGVERVLSTKLIGLDNVLAGLDADRLRHVLLFSSVAGFFGNRGQADYAMANEGLNRIATSLRALRPDTRVTSVNWGAWDGGMVTEQLRQMFAQRGVALVPVPTGAGMFAEQFTPGRAADTVIVIGPDTPLSQPAAAPAAAVLEVVRPLAPLAADPRLADHTVGADRLLPATFAMGAMARLVEQHWGGDVTQLRNVKVFKGVAIDPAQPGALRLQATKVGDDRVQARLFARDAQGLERPSYGAELVLGASPARPAPDAEIARLAAAGGGEDGAVLYRDGTLFHGPSLRGIRTLASVRQDRLVLRCRLADAPVAHGSYAARRHSPVLTDLLLQAALVWVRRFRGTASLPTAVDEMSYWEPLPDDGEFLLAVTDVQPGRTSVGCTVTAYAPDGRVLQRFAGVRVVLSDELEERFARSRALDTVAA